MKTWAETIDDCLAELDGRIRALRRHLHAHPEPSREEYRSTLELARHLAEAEIPYRIAPTGRGLIAGPEVAPGTPRVAIRADMDALRMDDAKGEDVPYRSTRSGVLHGCGHDAHSAMVLGAALALHRCRDQLPEGLAWRAIFQPAEETGEGAEEMIQVGAMEDVAAIVALHVDPEREVGRVGHRRGVLTAYCQELKVVIRGRGGHAARPQQSIDPIAAAVQFVSTVYQNAPRAVDSREPVVVTFGAFNGGDLANVIPERVDLLGTIRTLSQVSKERVNAAIRAAAQGVGTATGAEIELIVLPGSAAVVNDRRINEVLVESAAEVVGVDHVDEIPLPSLGGEDFSAFLRFAPGALLRLGVAGQLPWPLLHSPRFDIDERALGIGARILARSAVRLASGIADHGNSAAIRSQ